MKTTFSLLLIFSYLTFFAQENKSLTVAELLQKSIEVHDPHGYFGQIHERFDRKADMYENGEVKGEPRLASGTFDKRRAYFSFEQMRDGHKLNYEVQGDSICIANWEKPDVSEEVLNKSRVNCDGAKFFRDYFHWMIYFPMNLNPGSPEWSEEVGRETYKGTAYHTIQIHFEPREKEPVYTFYIHPESYRMEHLKFVYEDSGGKGEFIELSGFEEIEGILRYTQLDWYVLPDESILAVEKLEIKPVKH